MAVVRRTVSGVPFCVLRKRRHCEIGVCATREPRRFVRGMNENYNNYSLCFFRFRVPGHNNAGIKNECRMQPLHENHGDPQIAASDERRTPQKT